MNTWEDYDKVIKTIYSCKTIDQLVCATKMLGFWYDKYKNRELYFEAYEKHVKFQFKKLGGSDAVTLPFAYVKF